MGAYYFDLARLGHRVVAGDMARCNVEAPESHPDACLLESIMRLDACDLSDFSDGSFDAALILGALYHLTDASDRTR
ncbi:methyltransferase domain-containing protein [Paraeggerthella hongkongensis]|uniref:Methyltransferase type 11 domain-containing protein n=1 Tax=Paraeggerthella hongkongensis TaxID=230658 RepID=A0A3N0BE06_9ACTN|nr:hypothetical protein DMP08_04605 [Paraeggerthella hongkongensis]